MNSGTLTYHSGYNYGACLQAYALQTVVSRECGPNTIINFEPLEFVHSREMITKHPRRVKEVIKILSRLPYSSSLNKRQHLFDAFTSELLNMTRLCRTREEAIEEARCFDCLIAGSDQIWNLGAKGDEFAANTLFFFDFPKEQRRISYAASFGSWVKEAGKHEEEFLPWLKQFDAISVREQSGYDYLQSRGIDCSVNVDPTLLLDAADYRKVSRAPGDTPSRYVLMFGWFSGKDLVSVAKKASAFYGAPAINIVPPPRGAFSGIKRKLDVGPREFLYLIDHAEFVATNSFHGTVFSSVFKKRYASVYSGVPDTRMKSTLDSLGLRNRLVKDDQVDEVFFSSLDDSDFDDVETRLKRLRKDSIEYLRENVR
jgi:hypothetical protein